VAELPRAAAAQRTGSAAARETIGAWAGHALREAERLRGRGAATARRARREADRLRVRSAVAAQRASRAARARGEVALAWSTRAAGEADRLARRGARGAAASLAEAGPAFVAARRAALPAALLAALALFAPADHGSGTQEAAATYRTAAAQPVQLLVPEPRDLPGSAAEAAVSLPIQVLAQINARPWARIRIDGVDVGPTPLSHRLAPGVYRIDAEFADGRSLRRSVAIGPEQRFVALP
jgi:hypothetical protein